MIYSECATLYKYVLNKNLKKAVAAAAACTRCKGGTNGVYPSAQGGPSAPLLLYSAVFEPLGGSVASTMNSRGSGPTCEVLAHLWGRLTAPVINTLGSHYTQFHLVISASGCCGEVLWTPWAGLHQGPPQGDH